jgi:hypothetical protein
MHGEMGVHREEDDQGGDLGGDLVAAAVMGRRRSVPQPRRAVPASSEGDGFLLVRAHLSAHWRPDPAAVSQVLSCASPVLENLRGHGRRGLVTVGPWAVLWISCRGAWPGRIVAGG